MRRAVLLLALVAAACARSEPAPARRLVIAYPAGLPSADPFTGQHEEFSSAILANVFEGLVEVQPDLTLSPGLAESWHSPDDLTWVFRLRRDVRFHDGRVLTAADVVRSFEQARREPWLAGELEPVASVEARAEHEVVFRTRVRFGALPARLTYFLVTGPVVDGRAPGTGPYRLRSWSPGKPTILEAFDAYRGGAPSIREVEFLAIPDPRERARLVQKGDAHLTMDVRPEDRAALGAAPGVRVVARAGLRVVFLGLDTARPPFRDRRAREAVALALDKDQLVAAALAGLGERTEQIARPGEVGFEPALVARRHDVEGARKLLAQAGIPAVDVALDYPRGKYLAIDKVAEEIARQLAAAGLRVTPRELSPEELVDRVQGQRTSMFLLGWLNETGSVHETYASLLATPRRGGTGTTNGSGWAHPPFDTLLEQVTRESDNDRRGEQLRAATRMVDAELPVIPLYCQRDVYAFSDDLEFEPSLFRRVIVSRLKFKR